MKRSRNAIPFFLRGNYCTGALGLFAAGTLSAVGAVFAQQGQAETLTIESDVTLSQSAFLEIKLNGSAPAQFDQLVVQGPLSLGGELRVQLLADFVPNPSDTFEIVEAESLSGTFSNDVNGRIVLADGGRSMQISYSATGVTLSDFLDPNFLFGNGFED